MREVDPDVVGLSVMTFQRGTARKIIALVRALKPGVTVVVGGYDPSLASDVYEDPAWGVDVIVRGEGDITFRELLRALEAGRDLTSVAGLCVSERFDVRAHTRPAREQPDRPGGRAAESRPHAFSTATPSSGGRSTSSKPPAAAPTTAASVRSSRCAAGTFTPGPSSAYWPTSPTPARAVRAPSSSSTTTSR